MLKTTQAYKDGASLKMFKIELWLQMLPVAALVFTFLLLFNLVKVSHLYERANLIGHCLFQMNYQLCKPMNAISFIALSYLIYLMIFKAILCNNIKTNSIVSMAMWFQVVIWF